MPIFADFLGGNILKSHNIGPRFIERPEKFDVFRRPELYLLGSSSSQRGDALEDHARQVPIFFFAFLFFFTFFVAILLLHNYHRGNMRLPLPGQPVFY
jgi:hypothetical protein